MYIHRTCRINYLLTLYEIRKKKIKKIIYERLVLVSRNVFISEREQRLSVSRDFSKKIL